MVASGGVMRNYLALDCREFSICKAGGLHGQKRVCSMLAMATATANAGKTQVRLSGPFSLLALRGLASVESCAMRSETLVRMADFLKHEPPRDSLPSRPFIRPPLIEPGFVMGQGFHFRAQGKYLTFSFIHLFLVRINAVSNISSLS